MTTMTMVTATNCLVTGAHIHRIMFEHCGMDFPSFVLLGQTARKLRAELPDTKAGVFKRDCV